MPTEQIPQLFNMLPRYMREMDKADGLELVKRFLQQPQVQFESYIARVRSLSSLRSIATIKAELLLFLKDTLGFTSELDSITSRLSTADLRKLLMLAIPLWKKRGTEEGVVNVIRLLTGRASFLMDWFDFRFILGETMLGMDQLGHDPWLIGSSASLHNEYWSNLRLMDDGTLDRTLLLELCELNRPAGEHMEVSVLDFRDEFLEGLANWTNLIPSNSIYKVDGRHVLALPFGSQGRPNIPIAGDYTTYNKYTISFKFILNDENNTLNVRWFFKDDDNYNVVSIACNTVVLMQISDDAGSSVEGSVVFAPRLSVFTEYVCRIEVDRNISGRSSCRIYIDTDIVVDVLDMSGCIEPSAGSVLFENDPSSNGQIEIDDVEIWRNPLRCALVEPAGLTLSSNFNTL